MPRTPNRRSRDVSDYLRRTPKQMRELMVILREVIHSSIPDVTESMKFGVPFYSMNGLLCYLNPLKTKDGIYIGFVKGYRMSDEAGVFVGQELKQIRHIVYRKPSDVKRRLLKAYLQEALILNMMKAGRFELIR